MHEPVLYGVQPVEDMVGEPLFANLIPKVFHGIEFWTVWGQRYQAYVVGGLEVVCAMPTGAVEHQENPLVSMAARHFSQEKGHRLGINRWEYKRIECAVLRSHGSKDSCAANSRCQRRMVSGVTIAARLSTPSAWLRTLFGGGTPVVVGQTPHLKSNNGFWSTHGMTMVGNRGLHLHTRQVWSTSKMGAVWRSVLVCVAFGALTPTFAGPATLENRWGNIEGLWRFRVDPSDTGERDGFASPAYDDSAWRLMRVPGSWEPQAEATDNPPISSYDGIAWYRLRFVAPLRWRDKELELALGSVDDEDRAYLNGTLVGETGPGIERAVVKLRRYVVPSSCLQPGEENVLAVRVKDMGGPGGIIGPILFLLPKDEVSKMMRLPQSDRSLEERFERPPADARILKIVHSLPDAPDDQDRMFLSLISQGFGGIVTNVAFDDYMASETKWAAFVRGVDAAGKLGMSMWLYDECGYPSGAAGGITLRDHPEYEARGLHVVDAPAEGGTLTLVLPQGVLFRAVALPMNDGIASLEGAIDISSSVHDGKLVWEAPPGAWHAFVFTEGRLYEGTHAAVSLAYKLPYINLVSTEPTARFIEVTHAEYARRLGEDLGQHFVATFTDEPSLMSMFMTKQDHRVLPWAANLAPEFQRRRGYAIEPNLEALFVDAGPKGRKLRYDYWNTVGELVSENFFGQIQTWCRGHNILSGGHLLCEESFLAGVPLYGDFFRCARRLDAPSIDCLTSIPDEVPWFVARLISSAAELEGRTVTMCETSDHCQRYRPAGDSRPVREVTEAEIRGTCNRLILNGINTITSYYSFSGLSTDQMISLNEWVGRCCTMLRGGHQVADIALLHPIETAWVRFTPARNWVAESPVEAHRLEKVFHDAEENLFRSRRDFTHVDARALTDAKVNGGEFQYRDLRWRIVVLPDADTLPLGAWENLERFYQTGGVVIALTSVPTNSEAEFPSPRVLDIAKTMFGDGVNPNITTNSTGGVGVFLPPGTEALLPLVLDSVIEPEISVSDANAPLRIAHRRIDGEEVYFVINDSDQPWEGDLALSAAGEVEQWDPATGQMTPVGKGQGVHARFDSYGAMFFRFKEAVPRQRKQVQAGDFPGATTAPLPETVPTPSGGEFVTAAIEADPSLTSPKQTAWRVSGTITRGNVDTFLFATFGYPRLVDLHEAAYVVFDVWMPRNQNAAVPLLVILRDNSGVEYLAEAGVPMNAAGHYCCHVALNRFQRAGWCKISDCPLDAANISTIRVGWGGYYGAEKESVAFGLSAPRLASPR